MQIHIRTTNLELSEHFISVAEDRVFSALSRFAPMIHDVSAVLTDVNGPRGGDDVACRVIIRATEGWTVTVSDLDENPSRSLARAVRRARRVFARELGRRREHVAA